MGLAKDMVKDNKKIILLTLGLLVMSVVGVFFINNGILNITPTTVYEDLYTQPEVMIEEGVDYKVVIRTIYGDIKIDLYEDKAPNAVNSFLFLISEDFYDGLKFHKVITDFVLQAGDHIGDGNGNPGYELEQDVNDIEVDEYSVSMVNGSQFFIVPKGADVSQLSDYTVMGEVIGGFSVVDAIEKVAVEEYKPINDVTISSILIIEE
ncbi:TPA: peptidylprolyl isomerase [Patescibacteria group bacterium]|nr:peptidylprolyl isomerase [Patescibacteria group bacterium]